MQSRKPLVEAIEKHLKTNPVSFHMPGHKSRFTYGLSGEERIFRIPELDLTEIYGLDNLHCPNGVIREAQELAAQAYGTDRTYFLVNGSTCGIIASLLSVTSPGDCVIVDRFSHSSVGNGLVLGKLKPVYVSRDVDCETGIPLSIDPGEIERAVTRNPGASAIIVTSPSYYGICSDLEAVSAIAHNFDMAFIVDEAHGAHLKFCDILPRSAVDSGADIAVQSAHKTLPAMTQGSWMHVAGDRVDTGRLEKMLGILQSTSPSYPIMASLDTARSFMATEGAGMLRRLVSWVNDTRIRLDSLDKGFFCPGRKYFTGKGAFDYDDTKLVINLRNSGITGLQLDTALREDDNIYGEMYDCMNWLGITTVGNTTDDFNALVRACERVRTIPPEDSKIPAFISGIPPKVLDPWQVMERKSRRVPLDEARERIAASGIIPYPPGIPLVCPGERITPNAIEKIKEYSRLGVGIRGYSDGQLDIVD